MERMRTKEDGAYLRMNRVTRVVTGMAEAPRVKHGREEELSAAWTLSQPLLPGLLLLLLLLLVSLILAGNETFFRKTIGNN